MSRLFMSSKSQKRRGRSLTERVLFVLAALPYAKRAVVLTHTAVDAIPELLVHIDRDDVRAAHVEVDKEALVRFLGYHLEQAHHLAGEREAAVLGRDSDGGDVPVPLCPCALSLAQDWWCD